MGCKNSVEKYLDSLPSDIKIIDVSKKNLNYLPDLSRFKKLLQLSCDCNKLKSLPILPKKLEILNCCYNNLTSLPVLPKNLKSLYCYNNYLTSLPVLPEYLEALDCSHNKLTSLPILYEYLKVLICSNNNLTSLPVLPKNLTSLPVLPKNLKSLYCEHNELMSLSVLPENLEILYCDNNKLISLPVLPEKLKVFSFFENPIEDIIHNNDLNVIKKNIKILNKFRYLYYCLKYRKIFLRMMEPIIKKRYHPSYLDDLNEEDDLDEKLGEW